MQIKTSSGIDLDTVCLVDQNGQAYSASGGGGSSNSSVTGNVASNTTDTGNPVKTGGVFKAAPTLANAGERIDLLLNPYGRTLISCGPRVSAADGTDNALSIGLAADNGAYNNSSSFLMTRGGVFNGTTWDRQRGDTNGTYVVNKPVTAGGTQTYKIVSAASTNTAFIKASPGQIYGIQLSNSSASWRFVKLYNKTTAPTLGATPDVPVDIVGIPPGGRVEMNRHLGMPFNTGIAIAITGAYADTDTTATVAGDVVGSIQYF